jgi:ankyrin repeat protein
MIEKKAKLNVADNEGLFAMDVAAKYGLNSIVSLLLEKVPTPHLISSRASLFVSSRFFVFLFFFSLVSFFQGAEVSHASHNGWTALHWAIEGTLWR